MNTVNIEDLSWREMIVAFSRLIGAWRIWFAWNQLLQWPLVADMPDTVRENRLVRADTTRHLITAHPTFQRHINGQPVVWLHAAHWQAGRYMTVVIWHDIYNPLKEYRTTLASTRQALPTSAWQLPRMTPQRVAYMVTWPYVRWQQYTTPIQIYQSVRTAQRPQVKNSLFRVYVVL